MPDRPSLLKFGLALMLLGVTAVVLWTNVLPTSRTLSGTRQRAARTEEHNAALEEEIRRLEAEADRLATDRWTIERVLRDEYRMGEAGELRVR